MSQGNAPEEMNVYQNAEARLKRRRKSWELEQGILRYLKYPDKEITMYIPVGLDNGTLEVFHRISSLAFDGSRAGQGRIAFAPDVSLDESAGHWRHG